MDLSWGVHTFTENVRVTMRWSSSLCGGWLVFGGMVEMIDRLTGIEG